MRHLPNAITVGRILLIPWIAWLIWQRDYGGALWLFTLAALTDCADGLIARRFNLRSRFGAVADPLADKLTMLATTLALGAQGWLPVWLVVAIVTRDIVIVGGAIAYRFVVGRLEIEPTWLSKFNTVLEFILLVVVLTDVADYVEAQPWLPTLFVLVLLTVVLSGMQYVWSWALKAFRAHGALR